MMHILLLFVLGIHSGSTATLRDVHDPFTINITMNGFQTAKEDQYAYIQYQLPDEELTIIGYNPLVDMKAAHHMLTYACGSPGSNKPFWKDGSPCGPGEQVFIHGWARNAPPLSLPDDVGFVVGKNTPYKYIVVNIHYFSILNNDFSGNQLVATRKKRKYYAGVTLTGTNDIFIAPKEHNVRARFSCQYRGPPLTIFATRVHAHQWARVNSLYRIRDDKVTQIVKGDPQQPQSFYPLSSPMDIKDGDYIVGQCVYDSDEDRAITVGSTHNDEMCNVYAMYSFEPTTSDGKEVSAPFKMCWGNQIGSKIQMIPKDSEIPPEKPSNMDHEHHPHSGHGATSPKVQTYTSVEKWPDVKSLPPSLREIGGIALNNDDNELVVFHRGTRKWESKYFTDNYRFRYEDYGPIEEDVLIHIDARTGQVKSRWGSKMFYLPHGLTIDNQGNYWVTDIAMHQVFMFKRTDLTRPALTVGKKFTAGSGTNQFCRPADIAVMKNGDFFVADGYCNNRVVKFNHKGEYITEWGAATSRKTNNVNFLSSDQWSVVHSIALNEDAQILCVADRENRRIQCFNSTSGGFLREIRAEKREDILPIYAIEFVPNTKDTTLFAVSGGYQATQKKVFMINVDNGEVLTSFDSNPALNAPHDITVSKDAREIYVAELALAPENALHKFQSNAQKDLPVTTQKISLTSRKENFHTILLILISFSIPVLLAVIVGCFIRLKNLRQAKRVNTFLTNGNKPNSILSDWMNRRDGFERLVQHSDGENEPFDNTIGNDSDRNSEDEIVTIPPQQTARILNNTTNNNITS